LGVHFTPSNKDDNEEMDANVTIDVLDKPNGSNPTPTTPTTPAPKKPALPGDNKANTPPTLKPIMTTGGVAEVVTIKPIQDPPGVVVSSADWSLQLVSTTKFVQGNTEDTSSRVVIEKGNTVTTSGTGFKPFSQVDVYVYSTPTWLGAVMTDQFGNFTTTLPMPPALPEGDHTFQAKGVTPNEKLRSAEIPITLVPATIANKPGSMRFEAYFAMNGVSISPSEKANITRMVKIAKSKIATGAKVTIDISGWVQPNPRPGAIKYLSTNRAKNVRDLLKALGLRGAYTLKYPGLAKDNIPAARHASVYITWSKSK
jgi:outer membrane protein OmpA-like peptidoglycan-associated protein